MRPLQIGLDGHHRAVDISARELSSHTLILGGTGRGKSTLMEYMARGLTLRHAGFTLIDPHGSCADNLAAWLARNCPHRRVHILEPSAGRWCFGFNPLAFSKEGMSAGIQSVATSISAAWGHEDFDEKPRLRRVLSAVLCLLAAHRMTLADAVPILSPAGGRIRRSLGESLPHAFFRGEWQQFALMAERQRIEYFESVSNRLGPFLASDVARAMLGQTDRVLDVEKIMDAGDILIVNLRPSARFSVSDGKLVGTLLVNEFTQRALLRKPGARAHTLFIDEATRYVSEDIPTILDETRKYGLSLVAATQRLGAIRERGENIFNSMLSIQSKIVFGGLTADDAELIAREVFAGEFNLQRKKESITTPTLVGHRIEWMESESEADGTSDTDSWNESSGEVASDTSSESTQFDSETGEDLPIIGVGAGTGTSVSASHGLGGSRTHSSMFSRGRHQSLRPILENRSTATYTLPELIHMASVTLKNLPVGRAVAKIVGRRSVRMVIPRLGSRADAPTACMYRAQRIALTPCATPIGRALAQIDTRQANLLALPDAHCATVEYPCEIEITPKRKGGRHE